MDPYTVTAAAAMAAGAFALAGATNKAMAAPITVVTPDITQVTQNLSVMGDYFGRVKRNTSNAAWQSLPVPTTSDPVFWNAQVAEQPMVDRGVLPTPIPAPLKHSPAVYALTSQVPSALPPSY
jgi:hypothetical protein